MNPRIPTTRAVIAVPRMKGHVDVQFGFNPSGDKVVWFGGDLRSDETNVVTINGVDYVIAGYTIVNDPHRGWTPNYSGNSHSMTKLGTWDGPTDNARRALNTWAVEAAPRFAEAHHARWGELFTVAADHVDIDTRRAELLKVLANLSTYETILDMIRTATNHRVVRFAQSVTAGWKNGFASGNGGYFHHDHSGQAHAYLDIEIGGEWERVAVLVSGSVQSTTFTPIPLSLVNLRHEPELAERVPT